MEEEEKKIGESAMLDQKKADSVEATEVVAESDVAQQVKHVTDRVRGGAYQWWRLWRLIQLEIWLTRRALVSKCGRLATRAAEECNSCCVHNLAKQTGRAACRVGMLRY